MDYLDNSWVTYALFVAGFAVLAFILFRKGGS